MLDKYRTCPKIGQLRYLSGKFPEKKSDNYGTSTVLILSDKVYFQYNYEVTFGDYCQYSLLIIKPLTGCVWDEIPAVPAPKTQLPDIDEIKILEFRIDDLERKLEKQARLNLMMTMHLGGLDQELAKYQNAMLADYLENHRTENDIK